MSTNPSKLFCLQETKLYSHLFKCRQDLGTHFWWLNIAKVMVCPQRLQFPCWRGDSLLNQITRFVVTGFHTLRAFRQTMGRRTRRETVESSQQPCEWAWKRILLPWDAGSPSRHPDGILVRDPEPGNPAKQFLTHRNYEEIRRIFLYFGLP